MLASNFSGRENKQPAKCSCQIGGGNEKFFSRFVAPAQVNLMDILKISEPDVDAGV